MSVLYTALLTFLLFIAEILYFRIARRFNILDVPNNRSAHQDSTIRGIGIIFLIAALVSFLVSGFQYPYFMAGLLLVGTVSFIDDIKTLPNRYRIVAQFLSVGLLLYQVEQVYGLMPIALFVVLLIVGVGIINAYNFMDGINGITGAYSLLTIATLYYIDENIASFINQNLLLTVGLSICVFLFFNFRKKAIGFCGDVGSVSMAFIIAFAIAMLIFKTNDWKYIFLLSVYGIDTIYTLIYRLSKRENIFKAHKLHFFQILVHDYQWPHLRVSLLYVIAQLIVNLFVLQYDLDNPLFYLPLVVILIAVHAYRKKQSVALSLKQPRQPDVMSKSR